MKRWLAGLLALALCLPLAACGKKTSPSKKEPQEQEQQTPSDEENTSSDEKEIPLYTNQSMPIVRIETENGRGVPTDKSEAVCRVSLSSDIEADCQSDLGALIRVRGNGSLNVGHATGKYPYKIKFEIGRAHV